MTPHRVIITAAPGSVFLRVAGPVAEMTPSEALRVADTIRDCVGIALAAQDGAAVRLMLSR